MKAKSVDAKPPAGKSRSARANAHDWALLLKAVFADSVAHPAIDFDEHYAHAIQMALEGRNNAPLLKLLDNRKMLHPALLPALADVIRSQTDGARGAGALLTHYQDRIIRAQFDAVTMCRMALHESRPRSRWQSSPRYNSMILCIFKDRARYLLNSFGTPTVARRRRHFQFIGDQKMNKVTLGLFAMAAYVFATSAIAGETAPPGILPEPATLGLLAAGIAAAVVVRLRGRK